MATWKAIFNPASIRSIDNTIHIYEIVHIGMIVYG